jgi:extradiol dioxygenase family protein
VGVAILVALVASYLPRLLAVRRFQQPLVSALLHPLGVVLLLVVQWYALARQVFGRPVAWRARSYSSQSGEEVS